MAEETASQSSGLGVLGAVLAVAVGALLLLQFDVLGVRSKLMGEDEPDKPKDTTKQPDVDANDDRAGPEAEETAFSTQPPGYTPVHKSWDRPLPEVLEIVRKKDGMEFRLKLHLVKGGWFIQGENDNIDANMPKRWTWVDSYYMAETEATNDQFTLFVLDDGYKRPRFWRPEGYKAVERAGKLGTDIVGWRVNGSKLAGILAPQGPVVIEAVNKDGQIASNQQVLVLPNTDRWDDFVLIRSDDRTIWLLPPGQGKDWASVSGKELAADERLKPYFHTLDNTGRVVLTDTPVGTFKVVAFVDGLENPHDYWQARRNPQTGESAAEMPVTMVSWFEADACARYWGGRLPTEAEWEKAARGTDGRHYPWGNDIEFYAVEGGDHRTDRANFRRGGRIAAAGSFPKGASPYGILDMAGNVVEWVADAYHPTILAHPGYARENPKWNGTKEDHRCERGGSANEDNEHMAKTYSRRRSDPRLGNDMRGFRIAFDVDDALKAAAGE